MIKWSSICCKNLLRHTWLNLRVNATTLGAKLCFSFPFHPQLASSWESENHINQPLQDSSLNFPSDETHNFAGEHSGFGQIPGQSNNFRADFDCALHVFFLPYWRLMDRNQQIKENVKTLDERVVKHRDDRPADPKGVEVP